MPRLCDHDGALVDQHVDQLLHVVGVAFGAVDDELVQLARCLVQPLQQGVRQLFAVACIELWQFDERVPAGAGVPGRAALVQRGPHQADQQQRQVVMAGRQVLDEVQRGVVGPLQVVQQQQQRRARARSLAEHLACVVITAIADLAGLTDDAAHRFVGREVQAQQVAEHGRVGSAFEHRGHRRQPLLAGLRNRVAVKQRQVRAEQVTQQAVGLALAPFGGARRQRTHALRLARSPVAELGEQPRLADAGVAHQEQRHQFSPASSAARAVGVAQLLGLFDAVDHARGRIANTAPSGLEAALPRALHQIGLQRLVHALHRQRCLFAHVEQAAHVMVAVLADAKAPRRGRLLHARRDVHGAAAHAVFTVDASAQQNRPGMRADAHIEAVEPMRPLR